MKITFKARGRVVFWSARTLDGLQHSGYCPAYMWRESEAVIILSFLARLNQAFMARHGAIG